MVISGLKQTIEMGSSINLSPFSGSGFAIPKQKSYICLIMWPEILKEGVGGDLERAEQGKHYCLYKIVRGTVTKGLGVGWVERCRCGRCKEIDRKYHVEGSKSPSRTIRWYDAEGNLERITGDVDDK